MNDSIEHDIALEDIKIDTYSDLSKKQLINIIHHMHLHSTKYLSENMDISELEERVSNLERIIDDEGELVELLMSIFRRWWVRFQLYWKGVPEPSQRYPPTRKIKEKR